MLGSEKFDSSQQPISIYLSIYLSRFYHYLYLVFRVIIA